MNVHAKQNSKRNLFLCIFMCVFIIAFDSALLSSPMYKQDEAILTLGITLDFMIMIPSLIYVFYFRKKKISLILLSPILIISYFFLLLLLPENKYSSLQFIGIIILLIELVYIGYTIYKLYQARHHYRTLLKNNNRFDVIHDSIQFITQNSHVTSFIMHELNIVYYSCLSWRKKQMKQFPEETFTCFRESNWLIMIMFICKLLILEGLLLHFLIAKFSHSLAWLISAGNLYIIFMLIADYRAMCLKPITFSSYGINVQYGLQLSCFVPFHQIQEISALPPDKSNKKMTQHCFTPLSIEPNIVIKLKQPIEATLLFGRKKAVDIIYLHIDDPKRFIKTSNITESMQST